MSPTATVAATHETRLQAMGSEVHLVVTGADRRALRLGADHIRELEQRWSRFLPTSEISALYAHAGEPVPVSVATLELIERSLMASELTGGCFDPTVGNALVALGYDRGIAEVATQVVDPNPPSPAPGVSGIAVDSDRRTATLPAGVRFDPGGIGKGLAADITARALMEAGAAGALVNVGGDLRAVGQPPHPHGWVISVPHPIVPQRELLRLALSQGGVATSSPLRRRWRTTTGHAHHLIDPATGRPASTNVAAVTAVAEQVWLAEALTKFLMLRGPEGLNHIHSAHGAHGVVVTTDGQRHATSDLEEALL